MFHATHARAMTTTPASAGVSFGGMLGCDGRQEREGDARKEQWKAGKSDHAQEVDGACVASHDTRVSPEASGRENPGDDLVEDRGRQRARVREV